MENDSNISSINGPRQTADVPEIPSGANTGSPHEPPLEKPSAQPSPGKKIHSQDHAARTLAVDIGGTGVKLIVLDDQGRPVTERARVATPQPATPRAVVNAIVKLAKTQGAFDRVSVGFPGVVKDGIVYTAANLGTSWQGQNLARILRQKLHRPVRVCNDADVQGFGVIKGKGVEMVITLGTGVGSALFVDGKLVPNLELGHHPFLKGKTYEEKLGRQALEEFGKKKWNKQLKKAINELQLIFNYHKLYIGGGNAKFIKLKLPPNTKIVSNQAGLWGGIALWQD